MFFLLRMAFWLGLVFVLLPSDKNTDQSNLPQIGAAEALSAAGAAVSDMSQFCKRQPGACDVGKDAATVIGHRAQAGARKIYNIITEKKPDQTGSIGMNQGETKEEVPADTLLPSDLDVDWRGPIAMDTLAANPQG